MATGGLLSLPQEVSSIVRSSNSITTYSDQMVALVSYQQKAVFGQSRLRAGPFLFLFKPLSEPGGGKDTIALAELTFQSGAGLATEGVKNEADGKSLQTMAVTRLIMLPTQKCECRCPRILCALTGYCLS